MTFLAADGVDAVERGARLRDAPRHPPRGAAGRADRARAAVPRRAWPASSSSRWARPIPSSREHASEIESVLSDEEEQRSRQTLARGLKLFEEVAADGEISGDEAFRLHDTYGFPLELTEELARERGLPVDEDGFRELMEEQRARSRGAPATSRGRARLQADARSEFVGYEKTEVLTAIVAYEDLGDGRFQAKLEQSPFYPDGGGQVSDAGFIENEETGARAELVAATRLPATTRCSPSRARGSRTGMRVRAVVPWSVRFPTMANHTATHLLHKALQEVLGEHARQAGSAVRPDKLRFDFSPPAGADRGGAGRGRAPRERGRLPEPAGARVHRPDRRGAAARRDDALRREVRRRGAAGRHRRLLARALRRHARALDRGDRPVRDHLRELGRLGHAADRGGHLGRGVRAPARARRGGRRSCAPSSSGRARKARSARRRPVDVRSRPASEEAIGGVNVFVGQASGRRRRGAARGVRPDQAGARAGRGRARLRRGRSRAPRRQLRPLAGGPARRGRGDQGGGGRGRRRRRQAGATMARAGGRDPEKLGDALAKAEEALPQRARREGRRAGLRLGAHRRGRLGPDRHDRPAARRGRAGRERGRARTPGRARARRRAPSASSSACR